MASARVKICGVTDVAAIDAAARAGAAYIGLVFFDKSPRALSIDRARQLALATPAGLAKVALLVDPSDARLDEIAAQVPLDMLQLHGRESADRVAEIRARLGLPVMKAVGVADEGDLSALDGYAGVADQILIEAKAPKDADRPGGHGLRFDWRLIAGRRWPVPWMLAGGLTATNVPEAIRLTGARQVDVSSGVEDAPGHKDPAMIAEFCRSCA